MVIGAYDKITRDISLKLVKWIQDKISFAPRNSGKKIIEYKIHSNLFFEKLKKENPSFDDVEWVKVLHYIKSDERLQVFYHVLLDIMPQYDGKSSTFYPEAYPGDGKVCVRVKRKIANPSTFYPNCPGIEARSWSEGKIIFVPEEVARIYEQLHYIEMVDARDTKQPNGNA